MKATEKNKAVPTFPKGVWEASHTDEHRNVSKEKHLNNITTDAQGNGYPLHSKKEER